MAEKFVKLFLATGLDEKAVDGIVKNPKTASAFQKVLEEAGIDETKGCDRTVGNLLFLVASTLSTSDAYVMANRGTIIQYILEKKIATQLQMTEVPKYFKKYNKFDQKQFDEFVGVGISFTAEQITEIIAKIIQDNAANLREQRYRFAPTLRPEIAKFLKWADGKVVTEEFDKQILAFLGPRTEEDNKKPAKPAAAPAAAAAPTKAEQKKAAEAAAAPAAADVNNPLGAIPDGPVKMVREDELDPSFLAAREVPEARNTDEQMREHLKRTGGKILTRFPPEPNGHLHIGHAKSMNFNYGIAKKFGGGCIMRFDDTNPEAERKDYIDSILESVQWMGHQPCAVTYTSDYFPQLYDLAVKLIHKGLAYVDHQTAEEMEEYKKEKKGSPWRERPIEESLKLFEDMRKGKFDEGAATLRLKGDLSSPNPQMWDMVAYRIKYAAHPHAGSVWCIYPTYDYSHCIVDSLEDISFSCCTLEFEVRRDSYFWLLHILDLYKPKVYEYGRLNIEHNVMSKRRLLRLVNEGYINGWDDPRMQTINGLRRRGYTAEAINHFCEQVGVSRNVETLIPLATLEHSARFCLDPISRRAMAVLDPVKVVIDNWPKDKVEVCKAANFPQDESKGTHDVPLTGVVYIERSDFKTEDVKGYYGLAPNKEVHLKYAYNITCVSYEKDAKGEVSVIHVLADFANTKKPKGNLHWVSEPKAGQAPLTVTCRLYDVLFTIKDPREIGKEEGDNRNWLDFLNPNSLKELTTCYVDPSLAGAKPYDHFQFERLGFFVVDPDSTSERLILNRTCELKKNIKA